MVFMSLKWLTTAHYLFRTLHGFVSMSLWSLRSHNFPPCPHDVWPCVCVGGRGAVAELSLALGEEVGALVGGGSSPPRTLKDVSQQWVGWRATQPDLCAPSSPLPYFCSSKRSGAGALVRSTRPWTC